MRTLVMMMGDIFAHQQVEMFFAERNEMIEALRFDRLNPTFDKCLQLW